MKKYQDKDWLLSQVVAGKRLSTIAHEQNVNISTISKYYASIINSLSIPEAIEFINKCVNKTQLISPRSDLYKQIVALTDWLPPNTQLRERLWYIKHDTKQKPMCVACGVVEVQWDYTYQAFRQYCSKKCSHVDFTPALEKRKQTNLDKRGVEFWNQQHIDKESLKLLQDKEWLIKQHKVDKKSLTKIADDLKVHPLLPAQYLSRYGIPGEHTSQAATDLSDYIKSIYNGQVIINTRTVIPPYELDIFLPELNLAFEYNGIYWHSELAGKDKHYHINKTTLCEKIGITLMHVYEPLWVNDCDIMKSIISTKLNNPYITKIHARKCKIVIPSTSDVKTFLNNNHIQHHCNFQVAFGLEYQNTLVCVMTFGKSRFNAAYEWELLRLCSLKFTRVIGGASKLFRKFINEYDPRSVISYSDKSRNRGGVYSQLGFTYSHTSNPNYYYFRNNEFKLLSRHQFQKHKLPSKLEHFSVDLSEWDNMKLNKYNRIWDCGNDVWVYQG